MISKFMFTQEVKNNKNISLIINFRNRLFGKIVNSIHLNISSKNYTSFTVIKLKFLFCFNNKS